MHTGTGSPELIGIYGDRSSSAFDGVIDEMSIWTDVLSDEEVAILYSNKNLQNLPTVTSGTATSTLGIEDSSGLHEIGGQLVTSTTEYSGDVYDTMSNDNGWVVYGDGNEYSNDRINFSVTPADASSGSDRDQVLIDLDTAYGTYPAGDFVSTFELRFGCLLYTSDAADE